MISPKSSVGFHLPKSLVTMDCDPRPFLARLLEDFDDKRLRTSEVTEGVGGKDTEQSDAVDNDGFRVRILLIGVEPCPPRLDSTNSSSNFGRLIAREEDLRFVPSSIRLLVLMVRSRGGSVRSMDLYRGRLLILNKNINVLTLLLTVALSL